MNNSKACCPNSIPMSLLIECSNELVNPLSTMINISFKGGVFPDLNKVALVTTRYKKDDMTKCSNYRPISLLPNIRKILEPTMYTHPEDFFDFIRHTVQIPICVS